jgi:hypothetical protein
MIISKNEKYFTYDNTIQGFLNRHLSVMTGQYRCVKGG